MLRTEVHKKCEYIARTLVAPDGSERQTGQGRPDIFETFLLPARAGTALAAEYPDHHRLSIMLSREEGTPVYECVIRDLGQSDAAGLEQAVRAAIARGEIRSDLSEDLVLRLVSHLLTSFNEVVFGDEEWSPEAAGTLLEQHVEIMRNGLAFRETLNLLDREVRAGSSPSSGI